MWPRLACTFGMVASLGRLQAPKDRELMFTLPRIKQLLVVPPLSIPFA
jgi:hypothetical protein